MQLGEARPQRQRPIVACERRRPSCEPALRIAAVVVCHGVIFLDRDGLLEARERGFALSKLMQRESAKIVRNGIGGFEFDGACKHPGGTREVPDLPFDQSQGADGIAMVWLLGAHLLEQHLGLRDLAAEPQRAGLPKLGGHVTQSVMGLDWFVTAPASPAATCRPAVAPSPSSPGYLRHE